MQPESQVPPAAAGPAFAPQPSNVTPYPTQGYGQAPYGWGGPAEPYGYGPQQTTQQATVVNVQVGGRPGLPLKSLGMAYLMWALLGLVGGHHFYLGKAGRGLLYLVTFGLLGVGCFIDLFTLPAQVRQVNAQRAAGIG